jgi:hypothetical protein
MRKHMILFGVVLALSLMIGMQVVIARTNAYIIPAEVKIWPHWLCLEDYFHGMWITAFIRLPKEYDVKDINASTVTLQVFGNNVPVSKYYILSARCFRETLIARFDRASVVNLILTQIQHMAPHATQQVTLVVTGNFYDGRIFRGKDTIFVFLMHQ